MAALSWAQRPTALVGQPRASRSGSSSLLGSSRRGLARSPPLKIELQPAGGWRACRPQAVYAPPAEEADRVAVPRVPLPLSTLLAARLPRQATQQPEGEQRAQQPPRQQPQQQQQQPSQQPAPARGERPRRSPRSPSLEARPLRVQLNEPPPRPPQHQDGGERDKEFFANVGDAIRTLREDYPMLFVKNLNCEWGA